MRGPCRSAGAASLLFGSRACTNRCPTGCCGHPLAAPPPMSPPRARLTAAAILPATCSTMKNDEVRGRCEDREQTGCSSRGPQQLQQAGQQAEAGAAAWQSIPLVSAAARRRPLWHGSGTSDVQHMAHAVLFRSAADAAAAGSIERSAAGAEGAAVLCGVCAGRDCRSVHPAQVVSSSGSSSASISIQQPDRQRQQPLAPGVAPGHVWHAVLWVAAIVAIPGSGAISNVGATPKQLAACLSKMGCKLAPSPPVLLTILTSASASRSPAPQLVDQQADHRQGPRQRAAQHWPPGRERRVQRLLLHLCPLRPAAQQGAAHALVRSRLV